MKRRSRVARAGLLITFLDTLCNALAAILIIAIIQMHPSTKTAEIEGFSHVTVFIPNNTAGVELAMYALIDSTTIDSEESTRQAKVPFLTRRGSVTALITPAVKDITELGVFLKRFTINAPETVVVVVDACVAGSTARTDSLLLRADEAYSAPIRKELFR
ncbi:MAG: hypothetical protein OEV49_00320 [candidate division Zixibacteria bacterium]|nr:hypothetical protein [candidate division Zixibacteria bacterium]MDH3937334.1 hypothetical protein [candidate division Zixibacteria bacterium]MDH4032503.1 hypothetical protein [candidate division Zixibacteria bacterium]